MSRTRFSGCSPAGVVTSLAATVAFACTPPPAPNTRYVILFDLSGSASLEQQSAWLQTADIFLSRLVPGDAALVLAVRDHADGRPIFYAATSRPPHTYRAMRRSRQQLDRIRAAGMDSLRAAMENGQPSRATDIISLLDRLAADGAGGRRTAIILLSDMVNETAELNMKREPLSDGTIPEKVSELAQHHRWHQGELSGAAVVCVLNSVPPNAPVQLNDRQTLHRFWEAVFESLGARLLSFDTYVPMSVISTLEEQS